MENFVQAILESAEKPKFLVLGGDGRYYSREAISKILNICSANGVARIVVAQNGILSTPAASALIRSLKADGGIILTASHNPGGPDGDFGIKYNISNGGPAPEKLTKLMSDLAQKLETYESLVKIPKVQLDKLGVHEVGQMKVEVVDPIDNYLALMRQVFDLDFIKEKLFTTGNDKNDGQSGRQVKILADSMNGVMGPYAKRILHQVLGAPLESILNAEPLPDFGGKHPDPNLTYARELVDRMRSQPDVEFGVAFDGDGDRNMILGQGAFFVTPGDSLAVLADHLDKIKYFNGASGGGDGGGLSNGGKAELAHSAQEQVPPVRGFARSFPTSPAVDRVAASKKLDCYVTPTGWKFFGNLMDSGRIALCGEESFGTGSCHIREKDGLWAALAWLSVMAHTGKGVKQLVEEHWQRYGRDYFCRYDFEDCDSDKCQSMMRELEEKLVNSGPSNGANTTNQVASSSLVGKCYKIRNSEEYKIEETGNFEYEDPVDGSRTTGQGLFVKFSNGARIVWRLSGTGSSGATVRLYVSDYNREKLFEDNQSYLGDLLTVAYELSRLPHFTGREKPTVVT